MLREPNLEHRLDRVKEIKWVFIKRPLKDTSWTVQEPGQGYTQDGLKMDMSFHTFISLGPFT